MRQNNQLKIKGIVITLIVISCIALLSGCGKKGSPAATGKNDDGSKVVATYDGGKVTQTEFNKYLSIFKVMQPSYAQLADSAQFKPELLKEYVGMKVLAAKADDKVKNSVQPTVTSEMAQIKKSDTNQSLEQALKKQNLSFDDLQQNLQLTLLANGVLASQITEQQMKDDYTQTLKKDKYAFEYADVRHILIGITDQSTGKSLRTKAEALTRAKSVLKKLNAGGDFAALAKQYSDDPGSKNQGGEYKDQPVEQWTTNFAKAVETLPLKKISDPVETQYGYHLIEVLSRSNKTYDQVKSKLKSNLTQQAFSNFMKNNMQKLNVKINLPKAKAGSNGSSGTSTSTGSTGSSNTTNNSSSTSANSGSK